MSYHFPATPTAVLFDLDGTLVDSAPDLAAAVNYLRTSRGMAELPLAQLRPFASHGARGLIGAGLGVEPEDAAFPALRDIFLDYYEAHSTVNTLNMMTAVQITFLRPSRSANMPKVMAPNSMPIRL